MDWRHVTEHKTAVSYWGVHYSHEHQWIHFKLFLLLCFIRSLISYLWVLVFHQVLVALELHQVLGVQGLLGAPQNHLLPGGLTDPADPENLSPCPPMTTETIMKAGNQNRMNNKATAKQEVVSCCSWLLVWITVTLEPGIPGGPDGPARPLIPKLGKPGAPGTPLSPEPDNSVWLFTILSSLNPPF